MTDEGYIKFDCRWVQTPPLPAAEIDEINRWRQRLYAAEFIGFDAEQQVGYGNISIRDSTTGRMLISGTQTGNLEELTGAHYTWVTDYDLATNRVTCEGPIKASSESLTHLAIYELSPDYCAVIHAHAAELWRKLLNNVPTTDSAVPYGTPDMAAEIKRLHRETDLAAKRILVMAGHEDGVVSFGVDLAAAGATLLEYLQ